MAKRQLKEQVLSMRQKGMSYSQIKEKVQVSKGTLSLWLRDFPLPPEKIVDLRDKNPKRIESYRNTMQKKREDRLSLVYQKVSKDIGKFSKREIFLFGLALYWGEGGKTDRYRISLANTDPSILKFFTMWSKSLGLDLNDARVKLHLYSNMNKNQEVDFWSQELNIPKANFVKPYIKETKRGTSYNHRFNHGTCNLYFNNRDVAEYVLSGVEYMGKDFKFTRL